MTLMYSCYLAEVGTCNYGVSHVRWIEAHTLPTNSHGQEYVVLLLALLVLWFE